jgi:signal transduction histidine kinase/iron only hydrogenase large subunit-like protein
MRESGNIRLVHTIRERCRVCYTCVRECPAKAIRIVDGQAEVITERCIGCGNCVRVCGQHAKTVYDCTDRVSTLLSGDAPVAALLAPSFPAEFADWNHQALAGILRALGFTQVVEVAVGADLVSMRYRELMQRNDGKSYIATTCPAIVAYIEHYFPSLVDSLAPIVSPMVATSRALRHLHGPELKMVFIGPCIAKKGEAAGEIFTEEIDAVLTFVELRKMIEDRDLSQHTITPSDFDPPLAGPGALFSISRGLLQSANIPDDLLTGDVLVADGRVSFVEAIKEFHSGHCAPHLLEVLACEGCIMGPGVSAQDPLFRRRSRVSHYVKNRLFDLDESEWRRQMSDFATLDLSRSFKADDRRIPDPSDAEVESILLRMGKHTKEDELNCGACGYDTCREHAIAIYTGLAENEMCLPYTIDRLRETVDNLAVSNEKLARTQEILMQAEKLASMGQLAAGIAHELNNPLGVVLMYAHMLLEEMADHVEMREDLAMIARQADRCKKIVAGLLHFARQNKVALTPTDIRQLVEEAVKLVNLPEKVHVALEHQIEDPMAEIDADQVTQVLNNLITNACHAMPEGGQVTIRTSGDHDEVHLCISDTGVGIPKEHQAKIFEPFFTTKSLGKGTGMGLAVTYGIVKMHRGRIGVESNDNPEAGPTGTTFTVSLPRHGGEPAHWEDFMLEEERAGSIG